MRLVLRLQIDGPLHLRCQRCLGRLDYPLHLTNTLRLVEKGEKLDETLIDPEDDDCVEASDELDVLALVEDEILLSLPFSPRHEEACCGILPQGPGWDAAKSGAFAKLAGLKKA
ncbi:MAG: YceD family protein [Burkholderiales bacterium]